MSAVVTKTYEAPPLCKEEILRYAGCQTAGEEILALLDACLEEARDKLVYKVCYRELSLNVSGSVCDFGIFRLNSKHLAENLKGSRGAIVFSATVGVALDRLIGKYVRLSPSKAVMLQAIGAERIEALCDVFCRDMEQEKKTALKPRFSPGYGDLPLDVQKEIVSALESSKRIGVCLNESMVMSPSKSVTAFVGFTDTRYEMKQHKCGICDKKDCAFRSLS